MNNPRGVDGLALAVKNIEYHSADKESKDDECSKPKGIPADHHSDMV